MRYPIRCLSGVAAALFSVTACAQQASPPADDYDQDKHVPIARAQAGDGMVVLFDHSFECKQGKRALYVNHFMAAWLGCWTTQQGTLRIEFEDGEVVTGPAPKFDPQERDRTRKPRALGVRARTM